MNARPDIATPIARPRGTILLFAWRVLPLMAARIGIALARWWGKPFKLGSIIFAVRHRDVQEVLDRDLDFVIAPVDGPRFDAIGYHFILGQDRSDELVRERRALYTALAAVDMMPLRQRVAADIIARLEHAAAIDIVEDYARPIAAATAQALFGIKPDDTPTFMDAARAIFGHCFLNFSNDAVIAARATTAARLLTGWFDDEIARRHATGASGRDMMGALLRHGIGDDLIRRTLGGMLVGSIDTTATVVAKIATVMHADPALARAAGRDLDDMTRLNGWCQEALRRWPQTPLLARRAAAATTIGGIGVAPGDKVILWTQAAMHDATVFPDPAAMRPGRTANGYLHLGGGLHPCAGRSINAWQIPMLVGGLLARGPGRLGRMQWAGPFPARLPMNWRGGAT